MWIGITKSRCPKINTQLLFFYSLDGYYITGLLIRGVNASYISFNSLYNLNSELTQDRFLGKRGEYTIFGFIFCDY